MTKVTFPSVSVFPFSVFRFLFFSVVVVAVVVATVAYIGVSTHPLSLISPQNPSPSKGSFEFRFSLSPFLEFPLSKFENSKIFLSFLKQKPWKNFYAALTMRRHC